MTIFPDYIFVCRRLGVFFKIVQYRYSNDDTFKLFHVHFYLKSICQKISFSEQAI